MLRLNEFPDYLARRRLVVGVVGVPVGGLGIYKESMIEHEYVYI